MPVDQPHAIRLQNIQIAQAIDHHALSPAQAGGRGPVAIAGRSADTVANHDR